jgi:hypothetical protein
MAIYTLNGVYFGELAGLRWVYGRTRTIVLPLIRLVEL